MNESNIRFRPLDHVFQFTAGFPGVNALRKEERFVDQAKLFDLVVVAGVEVDLVSVLLEQLSFSADDGVFSAELLVRAVNKENSHARESRSIVDFRFWIF